MKRISELAPHVHTLADNIANIVHMKKWDFDSVRVLERLYPIFGIEKAKHKDENGDDLFYLTFPTIRIRYDGNNGKTSLYVWCPECGKFVFETGNSLNGKMITCNAHHSGRQPYRMRPATVMFDIDTRVFMPWDEEKMEVCE